MDEFVGEIRIFPLQFSVRDWAFCDGAVFQISQNTALYSILGTMYGGNGTSTSALPNLMDRAPMHAGTGPGLTPQTQGDGSGTITVTLLESAMPHHSHDVLVAATPGNSVDPTGRNLAQGFNPGVPPAQRAVKAFVPPTSTPQVPLHPQLVGVTGGTQAHNNMQPYLGLAFQIALYGTYPSRP